jgi:hypothetical protein
LRRAQLTPDTARRTYGDFFDRVITDREEERDSAQQSDHAQEVGTDPALPEAAPAPEPVHSPAPRATAAVATRPARPAARAPRVEPEPPPADPQRIKATFYLYADDIVTIDQIQTAEFVRTGKKPQRSEIVSRALRLIGEQELPGGIT